MIEWILLGGGALWLMDKLKWGPEREAQEAARRAKEEAERNAKNATECEAIFSKNILPRFFVVDSNIWMNERYMPFFRCLYYALKETGKKMILYGPQFDEICNIKKNTDYGEDRNARARLAINRVELFQRAELLEIKPINVEAQRGAYADPLILRLLVSVSKQDHDVALVSDDKELRIRARQLLADHGKGELAIVEGDALAPLCASYVTVKGLESPTTGNGA